MAVFEYLNNFTDHSIIFRMIGSVIVIVRIIDIRTHKRLVTCRVCSQAILLIKFFNPF